MEAELILAKQQVSEAEVVREHVSGMFDEGLLKMADDGQGYQVVDNPAERSKLKQSSAASSKQRAEVIKGASA